MIPAVPTTRLLLLLTTLVAVLTLMSSWVPQVGAVPVVAPSPDPTDQTRRRICSTDLTDIIQLMCQGNTLSYRDVYPGSFGKRKKREFFNVADQCCKDPCSLAEMRQFCSP